MILASSVTKDFGLGRSRVGRSRGSVRAVAQLDLEVGAGEILGIVGPVGAGKSTVGLLLSGRLTPDSGTVSFHGADLARAGRRQRTSLRDDLEIVRPGTGHLPARRSVGEVLKAALARGADRGPATGRLEPTELLAEVGLAESVADVLVGRLTAQERGMVEFARVVASRPALVVVDQPDESVSAEQWAVGVDRLLRLSEDGTALVILAEALDDVVPRCERVAIMYAGSVIEILGREDLPAAALHPYSHTLLAASFPEAIRSTTAVEREPLEPDQGRGGCVYRNRCFRPQARCASEVPQLSRPLGSTHPVACHFPEVPIPGASGPSLRPEPDAAAGTAEGSAAPAGRGSTEPTGREFAEG